MSEDTENTSLDLSLANSLTPAEQDIQFVAVGTDISTNPKFEAGFKISTTANPGQVNVKVLSYNTAHIIGNWEQTAQGFTVWPLVCGALQSSEQNVLRTLTTQEIEDIGLRDTQDLSTIAPFKITRTIADETGYPLSTPFGGAPSVIQMGPTKSTAFPITFEIEVVDMSVIESDPPAQDLETNNKTIVGAINEIITDEVGLVESTVSTVQKSLLYDAVGNYLSHDINDPNTPLNRLSTIPVLSADKVKSFVDGDGVDYFPVSEIRPDSPVNLLEAVWTNWKNTVELNTDVYGISALNVPDLSATSFIADLSGKSIIENMNDMYTTMQACCSGEVELTSVPGLSSIYNALSALSAENDQQDILIQSFDGALSGAETDIITIQETIQNMTGVQSLSTVINSLTAVDTVTMVDRLSGLTDSLSSIDTLSGNMEYIQTSLESLSATDLPELVLCCEENRAGLVEVRNRFDNLDTSSLSAIADSVKLIDIDEYLNKLTVIEQQLTTLGDINQYITTINENTANIENNTTTFNTQLSSLSSEIYQTIGEVQNFSSVDVSALTGIADIITNIQDIGLLLEQLSGNQTIDDLQTITTTNNELITQQLQPVVENNTTNIQNITTDIQNLSASVLSPTGVVKTTTNQTVSGEKNFKSTFTVGASSYFEDTVTIGDVNQPKIFDVCSTNGITTVNIANLPVSSNGLNPGDLYVTEIDGKKILAIV